MRKSRAKAHEIRMQRMEDILNLPVQDPPLPEFSAAHLEWVKVDGGRHGCDDIALIPFSRVGDFIRGESTNAECPTSFRVEARRKRAEGSLSKPRVDGYLEHTIYWCSYGPDDYRDNGHGSGEGDVNRPAAGKGSRPGRRHMMRGCLCHFTVKRLYTRPSIALLIYNQRNHVDKTGSPCHGTLDRDAVGTRAMYAPRISEELRQCIMSMLYMGIPLDTIMQNHKKAVDKQGGPNNRDDLLTRSDVRNIEKVIKQTIYELDPNDLLGVQMWAQRHKKYVFFTQDLSAIEPFVLGIQTEWQLQQMIQFGHKSFVAIDSSFGANKHKYPFYSLLVFNEHQSVLPVAWIITSSFSSHHVYKCIGALCDKVRSKDSKWKPYGFMIDDAEMDASVMRDIFQCRIMLCLWHIRRSWLRNIVKCCCSFDVKQEMFRQLGCILYATGNHPTAMDSVEEFTQVFVDQSAFLKYFKARWLPKIERWITAMKILPVANQEMHGAMESYHAFLKLKLSAVLTSNASDRVDLLVHKLVTEVLSYYWFDQYSQESGSFRSIRDECVISNSWQRAIQIPDSNVIIDEDDPSYAKVVRQSDHNQTYVVWNPGTEFAICDCSWSSLGNVCKHIIKVNGYCRNHHLARPSLALQKYHQTILNMLQNPPDDPIVLDHAIIYANRMQDEIKLLAELSDQGLLQPTYQLELQVNRYNNSHLRSSVSVDKNIKRKRHSSHTTALTVPMDLSKQSSTIAKFPEVSSHVENVQTLEAQHLEVQNVVQESFNAGSNTGNLNVVDTTANLNVIGNRENLNSMDNTEG